MAFKYGRETILYSYADGQIGPGRIEKLKRGGSQDAVPERPEADETNACAFRQLLQEGHATPLRLDDGLNNGLINQHDGDVIPHRIDAIA